MLENIKKFFTELTAKTKNQKIMGSKKDESKKVAKERLHIVLVQDRANISQDFLDLMKKEILDVIKKYVIVDESKIDVRFTNSVNHDGTTSAPSLYANVPILNIRNEMKSSKLNEVQVMKDEKLEEKVEEALKNDDFFNENYTNKEEEKSVLEKIVEKTEKIKGIKDEEDSSENIKILINKDDIEVTINEEKEETEEELPKPIKPKSAKRSKLV